MSNQLSFQKVTSNEYLQTLGLIRKVFDSFIGPTYSEQGSAEFYKYIDLTTFSERQKTNHFTLVAKDQDRVVGVIEVRDFSHVAMLFVDGEYQHQGIGKRLLADALAICKNHNPDLKELTVHSSINACPIYRKLGFVAKSEEKEVNGIRFTTMGLRVG